MRIATLLVPLSLSGISHTELPGQITYGNWRWASSTVPALRISLTER